jgi:hypothetical protein
MDCKDNCPDHTGQEERILGLGGKLNILIVLLLLQLSATGTIAIMLNAQTVEQQAMINKLDLAIAISATKIQTLEEFKQIANQRLDDLSRKIERGR